MPRRLLSGPRRRAAGIVVLVLSGIVAAAIGLALLRHPIAGWPYGEAHKSDAPPVIGIGLLVWPALLIGAGARRLWRALWLDIEARRARRRS